MSTVRFPKKYRTRKGLWAFDTSLIVVAEFRDINNATILEGTTNSTYRVGSTRSSFNCLDTDVWEPLQDIKNIKYNLKDKVCVK